MIGKSLAATLMVLASLLCCAGLSAQPQRALVVTDPYLQTVWTTENGLRQNSVTAIVQPRDGYLWLSTFGGLARFDGVRFTIFRAVRRPPRSFVARDRKWDRCALRSTGARSGGWAGASSASRPGRRHSCYGCRHWARGFMSDSSK